MHIWLLWLRNRWQSVGAITIAMLALGIIVLIGWGGPVLGIHMLGNVEAPRAAAANGSSDIMLPRSGNPDASANLINLGRSILDTPAPAEAGPQTVAEAQASWSTNEIAVRQNALLSAINCARQQQKLPAVMLDAQLSETAGAAWLKLAHDPSFSLMNLPGQYAMRSVLPLAVGVPSATGESGQAISPTSDNSGYLCAVDGFDPSLLPATSGATHIGIAVFPPQASWDMASAVVLVQ